MDDAGTFDDTMLATEGELAESKGSGGEGERGLQRGAMLGRYVVLELLGAGGMGEVYTAYDPELDRRVALKVLRPSLSGRTDLTIARARLQREAQAMAKLAHPNVITVFDVGTIGEDVYVAMEYVAGTDLRGWLDAEPREWSEILERFVEAAHGLEAAHAAEIIHRDFKADNVLLGDDGRVRVIDFGLAHQGHNEPAERTGDQPRDAEALIEKFRSQLGDGVTTKTGTVMGTPAYMASEQFFGDPTDARTDQFNFAAALYEALYGRLPFEGDTVATLMISVTEGQLCAPPADSKVPGWLFEALSPALESDPRMRYPSMEALLDALEPPLPLWRKLRFPVLAASGVALAATLSLLLAPGSEATEPCADMGAPMEAAWTQRKPAVERAISNSGAAMADAAWRRVEGALDRYAHAWTRARRDSCEATAVRKEQSEQMLERRMSCLDARLREVDALVTVLAVADAPVVQNAARAAASLADVDACANRTRLGNTPIPPPAKRARAAALEGQLAAVRALKTAGKYTAALTGARAAVAEARRLGWQPAIARALYWIGDLDARAGKGAEAMEALFESVRNAAASGDVQTEAMAWVKQVHITGVTNGRVDEGLRWAEHARVALVRAGGDPDLESELWFARGHLLARKKRYQEAISAYRSSMAIARKAHGDDHWMVAVTHAAIGSVHTRQGAYADAVRAHQKSATQTERALGPNHPHLSTVYSNLGNPLRHLGRYAEAKAAYERALAIKKVSLAPNHPSVSLASSKLALVEEHLGNFEVAARHLERALEQRIQIHGTDHARVDTVRAMLSRVRARQGKLGEALALRKGVLERAIARKGGRSEEAGAAHSNVCDSLRRMNQLAAAQKHCDLATSILGTASPGSAELATALTGAGMLAVARGRFAAAIEPLERALEIRSKSRFTKPHWRARTRFALARALRGAKRPGAEAHARAALDDVTRTPGPGDKWLLPRIRQFLRKS